MKKNIKYIIIILLISISISKKDCKEVLENGLNVVDSNYKSENIYIQRVYDGKIINKDIIINDILKSMSAKMVSSYIIDDKYVVYAYTKDIHNYKNVMEEKININIVFSYIEKENVTCLYLASPVMNTDF